MNPLQFSVYKGIKGKFGALQFNFQNPHYYNGKLKDFTGAEAYGEDHKLKEGWKQREGCVFLEITSTKEPNVYDWENKVTVALSVTDLGKVLNGLITGNEVKIMHDPGAKSDSAGAIQKHVNISSPNGTSEGCLVAVSQVSGQQSKRHMVPLNGDELLVLRCLIQTAVSKSLGW